ncbi:hypothetical protein ACFQO1_10895 [Jejudonia soesokkakensis]|uniref:Uncharacterized protein n=1 Tax=Jejudonia soesokkakensis TaxID=1323432 RepID=A0ABW2MTE0_9FLAO
MTKKTPMLDKDKKNEQQIENQDYPGEPNSAPNSKKSSNESPSKENPKKVPESNDRAGYGEKVKRSDKDLPKINEDSTEEE